MLSGVLFGTPERAYMAVGSALKGAVWNPDAGMWTQLCTQRCWGNTGADGVWFRAEGMDVPLCVLLQVLMDF